MSVSPTDPVRQLEQFNSYVEKLSQKKRYTGDYWISWDSGSKALTVVEKKAGLKPDIEDLQKGVESLFTAAKDTWKSMANDKKNVVYQASKNYEYVANHIASTRFWTWKRILGCIGSAITLFGLIPFVNYYDRKKEEQLQKLNIDLVRDIQQLHVDDWIRGEAKEKALKMFQADLKQYGYHFDFEKINPQDRTFAEAVLWFNKKIQEKGLWRPVVVYDQFCQRLNLKSGDADTLATIKKYFDQLPSILKPCCVPLPSAEPDQKQLRIYLDSIKTAWNKIVDEQQVIFKE